LGACANLEGGDQRVLVDQATVKREHAKEQVPVGVQGGGSVGRRSGRRPPPQNGAAIPARKSGRIIAPSPG
jgi:hypothetical protein